MPEFLARCDAEDSCGFEELIRADDQGEAEEIAEDMHVDFNPSCEGGEDVQNTEDVRSQGDDEEDEDLDDEDSNDGEED